MAQEIARLEKEIHDIKARNARVELDKKWETSWTRRLSICVLTFIVILIYNFFIIKKANFFLASFVPVVGFFLSTLGLNFIRKIWEKRIKHGV